MYSCGIIFQEHEQLSCMKDSKRCHFPLMFALLGRESTYSTRPFVSVHTLDIRQRRFKECTQRLSVLRSTPTMSDASAFLLLDFASLPAVCATEHKHASGGEQSSCKHALRIFTQNAFFLFPFSVYGREPV